MFDSPDLKYVNKSNEFNNRFLGGFFFHVSSHYLKLYFSDVYVKCLFCYLQYNEELHYVEPCLNGTLVQADRANKEVRQNDNYLKQKIFCI